MSAWQCKRLSEPQFAQLERLSYHIDSLANGCLRALAQSLPSCKNLTSLHLMLDTGGFRDIDAITLNLPSLRSLRVDPCLVGPLYSIPTFIAPLLETVDIRGIARAPMLERVLTMLSKCLRLRHVALDQHQMLGG